MSKYLKLVINQIAAKCAREHGTIARLVINGSTRGKAFAARQEAIIQIQAETGCSTAELARVWGLDECTVRKANRDIRASRNRHSPVSRKLSWQYGPERAALILSGADTATQADVESWNRLGRRVAA